MPTPQQPARPPRAAQSTQDFIAGELRDGIVSGRYPVDTALPSEHDLCARYNVARNTVRRALQLLIDEGLIVNRPRRGYFVTSSLTATWDLNARVCTTTQASPLTVATAEPDEHVGAYRLGELLGLGESGLAVCRARVFRDEGGTALAFVADYVDFDIARTTPLMRKQPVDTVQVVAEATGSQPHPQPPLDDIRIRTATEADTETLGLPDTATVLTQTRRVLFDPGARCLVVGHAVYRTGPGINFLYGP
ncbi:GntR family transcriptional regulator [Actinomadura violacea]|uniref:GntR family transcriptional regulator n=1 Tax=Actinomadura violacea TaxID=2819934 RepID=A0ABS3RY02_9ACTN|nr:winged helix-turn-helix domain-containing protein [Actinomadura violacea]MBO2461632.1 GntR family transcriptional regulator [Actinomadura violacea]